MYFSGNESHDGYDDDESYHLGQINPNDEDDDYDNRRTRWEKFTDTFPSLPEPRVLDTDPKLFLSMFPAKRTEAEAERTEVEGKPTLHARLREAAKAAVALNAHLDPVVYRPISELLSHAEEQLKKGSELRMRAPFSQSQSPFDKKYSRIQGKKQREEEEDEDEEEARYETAHNERRRAWESDMDVAANKMARLHLGHDDVPFDAPSMARDDVPFYAPSMARDDVPDVPFDASAMYAPFDGTRRRVLPRSTHAAAETLYDAARAQLQARARQRDKPVSKAYVSAETPRSIPNKLTGGRRQARRAVDQYLSNRA